METTIKIRHNLLAINHDLETQTAQFYKVHVLNITGYGRMHLEHNLITKEVRSMCSTFNFIIMTFNLY